MSGQIPLVMVLVIEGVLEYPFCLIDSVAVIINKFGQTYNMVNMEVYVLQSEMMMDEKLCGIFNPMDCVERLFVS
ncbi:hypothetical protein [Bacillus sp. 1P06AnD]|uniref:hypothetical protein n=1 Tax=Bacillus sp. 1P06AnD TaxID=3132208 RepID=UPI0039A1D7A1